MARPARPASPPQSSGPTPRAAPSPVQRALQRLGLQRPIDLVLHLPLRWDDETHLTPIAQLCDGQVALIEGEVLNVQERAERQCRLTLQDASGRCVLHFFNVYAGLRRQLTPGARLRVLGDVRGGLFGPTLLHPALRTPGQPLPSGLSPVYPSVAGLAQRYLRKAIASALVHPDLAECLPPDFWDDFGLQGTPSLREALQLLHQPETLQQAQAQAQAAHPLRQRLIAEELLAQQLAQHHARAQRAALHAPALISPAASAAAGADSSAGAADAVVDSALAPAAAPPASAPAGGGAVAQRLRAALPFALTGAQQRVVAEIGADLAREQPMHRLLQGDVGAGKTVVAALAAAQCLDAGWQCALMAPTELLAAQHSAKLLSWLAPLGVRVVVLGGAQGARERRAALAAIADGSAQLVVGTHALVQRAVRFARLGLAIIDEQHRFGVAQRLALRAPALLESTQVAHTPHLLMMSATPIPRTLAMSYLADLDVSSLDELPPGRTPVATRVLPEARRPELIERLRSQLAAGRQAYWVCPLVEESEALDLANACATHAELSQTLAGLPVGLLHARLGAAEKQATMDAFARGALALLVATTVIEVGVDVPNASVMVIEHAERFGLSQLHQLRGRVGRGAAQSACVLLYSTGDAPRLGEAARTRLAAMVETNDGFEIARRDLALRGPGEFLGARQSGTDLLRVADPLRDAELLERARALAPRLWASQPQAAQRLVARWLGDGAALVHA